MTIKKYHHRNDMYLDFPKNAVCAELGVWAGHNALSLLQTTDPAKLYLVDPYAQPLRGDAMFDVVTKMFDGEENVEIVRQWDWQWLESLNDECLDWVYLDSLHTLESTARELESVLPKLKQGGILAGHDFVINREWELGVVAPVIELLQSGKIRMTGMSIEQFPSFMCVKL